MVIWSDPAIDDLYSVFAYIATDSKYYAEKLIDLALDKSKSLNEFPKIGRIVPEQKNRNVRELFIYSYRMIYQISNSDIEIIAFVHSARDLTSDQFKDLLI